MCSSSMPASRRAGDIADQARADDGAVRLVHERAERPRPARPRHPPPRSAPTPSSPRITSAARRTPSRASAPDHSTSSTVDPSALTHCASTSSGISARSRPGPSLMPVGHARRRDRTPSPATATSPRAACARSRCARPCGGRGRATPHPRRRGRIAPRATLLPHRSTRVAERREVVGGDRRRHLVGVDAVTRMPRAASPRASPPIPQPRSATRSIPASRNRAGVPRGDGETGRLLEAGAGEQHPLGEVAELRARPHAQAGLPDDRRDELGGVAVLAQPRDRAGDIVGGFDRRSRASSSRSPSGVSSAVSSAMSTRPSLCGRVDPDPAASPTDPL